jgi:putative tricarboxylic transport membrane protein
MTPFLEGLTAALTLTNILAGFIGVLLGTVVGVLPGFGPVAAMALTLPFTVKYGAAAGLIMLAGIWYGSQYGGSTTSILVNIPGEAASVVTCLDGHQMARRGRAGSALALVAIGSFVAGTIGLLGLQLLAPALGRFALAFGPPEYTALMIVAFLALANLIGGTSSQPGSTAKGVCSLALGLWLSTIGLDAMAARPRFTFGIQDLMLGIEFFPVAMGLFGVAEIMGTAAQPPRTATPIRLRLRDLYPTRDEARRSVAPALRGSVLGFFMGLLPGPSTVLSTWISYAVEKRVSSRPQEFGTGMVEGVVGPESANNSAVMGSMIPLLTLGIPFAAPSALMLAGLRMNGVEPGPLLFREAPQVFWTFVAAMYIGNVILLILNLPLVRLFAPIATLSPSILMPIVSIASLVGVYTVRNSFFDVWVMLAAGAAGYVLTRFNYPIAPLVLGLVLGPMTESSLRKSLMMLNGDFSLLLNRPITLALLSLAVVLVAARLVWGRRAAPSEARAMAAEGEV